MGWGGGGGGGVNVAKKSFSPQWNLHDMKSN